MLYIIGGIIIYIISLLVYKRARNKKFSFYRKLYSTHNTNPRPKRHHYKSPPKQPQNTNNLSYMAEQERINMQNQLRNEQLMEYMMYHNMMK